MLSRRYIGGIVALLIAYYLTNRNYCKKEGETVETKSGSLKGIISLSRDGREFYEWLGIPYAQPPVGALRFATPKPIGKWEGIRDASAYGSVCAQTDFFDGRILGLEDCLFLNVFTPKTQDEKKLLPVMYFIHGGYFACGSSDQYKPDYFMDEDVVLVTVNYRLGALGFLNTGDAASRGNMGLKDQSLALKWVKENIANFGGDPNQITIFGESAGAGSIHFQIISPMSHGLMNRAISQSGSAYNMWAIYDDPIGQSKRFAGQLTCPTGSTTEMLECLRSKDVLDILEVHLEAVDPTRTKQVFFVPTVETIIDEETFLPAHPHTLYKSGKIAKIPWLTGFNADEGLVFGASILNNETYRSRLETDLNYMAEIALYLSPSEAKAINKIASYYFGKESSNLDLLQQFNSMIQLITDRWFSHGIHTSAVAHSKYAPVQLYYYNEVGPSIFEVLKMIEGNYPVMFELLYGLAKQWVNSALLGQAPVSYGVCHGDELPLLFNMDMFNVPTGDPHYQFSKDLVKTWAEFASTPNVQDTSFRGVKFPLLNTKGEPIVTEIKDVPEIKKMPIMERIEFWKTLENL